MNLLDTLAYDAANTFLADFGETVTYTPVGNSPIALQALVYRLPASAAEGLSGSGVYKHEIMIACHPTAGVQVVNKGRDTVAFANRIGGTVESFVVREILQTDQGMWHLGVG